MIQIRHRKEDFMGLFKNLHYDIHAIMDRDPAARNPVEVFLLYSGLHAVINHRIASWFYRHHMKFIARLISQISRFFTGIEIHPGAVIGRGLFIDHGMGVVIGETTIIGDDCTIYQGATLGGTGKHNGKRHPTLGNNVMVGSGAKILGPFSVGNNVKVAAGAVVLNEVPDDCTCAGVPARIVRQHNKRVSNDLDQIHIPDPISMELCKIYRQMDELKKQIKSLEEKGETSHENL